MTAVLCTLPLATVAQQATVRAKTDAAEITVGDQVKLSIEASHNAKNSRLQWASIPDTFNSLEVVSRGKIDTLTQGDVQIYRQELRITGFDSGLYQIPSFRFPLVASGQRDTLLTDSFLLLVQTLPVDTTQPFRGIKEIMEVKTTWKDYLWWFAGAAVLLILISVVVLYFRKNRKVAIPAAVPAAPRETPAEKALRLLGALEQQQLWQGGRTKEYYVVLTDILRGYIEERFGTQVMELTTDQLLEKARRHPEMNACYDRLATVLYTADLAKFARAEPLPQEHTAAMEQTRQFIAETKPAETNAANPQQRT